MKTRCMAGLLFLLPFSLSAQKKTSPAADTAGSARVEITVTNLQQQPRAGERILFWANNRKKEYNGRAGANGHFTLYLPAGDTYTIRIKSITDTTQYGNLEIAALQPGQFFTDPFKVLVEFEPARSYTLDNVQYDVGKATLNPSSFPELLELLDYLKWKDKERIEIAGHTDNAGTAADNQKLSQQRAGAVKKWLVEKGIAASRIVARGYGASQPVAGNDTEAGRRQNRRTEVKIL